MAGDIFLGGTVRPGGPFASTHASEARGGFHSVADMAARNAIVADCLEVGMQVYTEANNTLWKLLSTGPSVWVPVKTIFPIGVQAEPPTGLIVRYARSTGNDTTGDGLSPGTAYLTPERCRADCPSDLDGNSFRVDMTDYGVYVAPAPFVMPALSGNITNWSSYGSEAEAIVFGEWQRADFEFYAEPTVLAGPFIHGTYTDTNDGTAALHTVITVPGQTWTVDQWIGKLIILKGYGIPSRVISNTADTITCTIYQNFSNGFSAAADFVIATESCTIDLTTAGWWLASLNWQRQSNYSFTMGGFNFTGGYYADLGFVSRYTTYIACNNLGIANYSDYLRVDGCHLTQYFLSRCRNGSDIYYSTYVDLGIMSNENGWFTVIGCWGTGGDSIGEGAYHGEYGANHQPRVNVVIGTTHKDTPRGGVRLVSRGGVVVVGYCQFDNCGYGAIRLEEAANCLVIGRIKGSGNGANVGGHGAYVLDNSTLQIGTIEDVSPNAALDETNVTITGPSGDIQIGNSIYPGVPSMLPTRSWLSFFQQYPKKIHNDPLAGGSKVYQRNGDTDANLVIPSVANSAALPLPNSSYLRDGNVMLDMAAHTIATFMAGFWYENGNPIAPLPMLTSLNVNHGDWGATIVVTGTSLNTVTSFYCAGGPTSFTIDSPTQITFTVPYGSTSGLGSVQALNLAGSGNELAFTVDHVVTSDAYVDRIQARFDEHLSGLGLMWFLNQDNPEPSFGDDDNEYLYKENPVPTAPIVPVSSHAAMDQFPFGNPHGAGVADCNISDDYADVDLTLQYWVRPRTAFSVSAVWPDFAQTNARVLLQSTNLGTHVVAMYDDTNTEVLTGTTVLLANTTYMITLTCAGTGGAAVTKLYVNGVMEASVMGSRLNFTGGNLTKIALQGATSQYFSLEYGAHDDATIAADYAAGIGP